MNNPVALPKWVGLLSIVAAVFGALNTAAILTLVGPGVGSVITAIAAIAAAFSHSLLGNGGNQP